MNKQNISKLNLFLMGLENRFIENKDIFIEIVVKYTTGLKNFKGIAVLDNNNLAFILMD